MNWKQFKLFHFIYHSSVSCQSSLNLIWHHRTVWTTIQDKHYLCQTTALVNTNLCHVQGRTSWDPGELLLCRVVILYKSKVSYIRAVPVKMGRTARVTITQIERWFSLGLLLTLLTSHCDFAKGSPQGLMVCTTQEHLKIGTLYT